MADADFCCPYNTVSYTPSFLEYGGNYIILFWRFNVVPPKRLVIRRIKLLANLAGFFEPELRECRLHLLRYRQESSWQFSVFLRALKRVKSRKQFRNSFYLTLLLPTPCPLFAPAKQVDIVGLGPLPSVHIFLLLLSHSSKFLAHLGEFCLRLCRYIAVLILGHDNILLLYIISRPLLHPPTMPEKQKPSKMLGLSHRAKDVTATVE